MKFAEDGGMAPPVVPVPVSGEQAPGKATQQVPKVPTMSTAPSPTSITMNVPKTAAFTDSLRSNLPALARLFSRFTP